MNILGTNPLTVSTGKADAALAAAIDLARAAAVEEAGPHGRVGDHLGVAPGVEVAGAKVAVHGFACLEPGYVGWFWAVEVVRVPRSKAVTVSDVVVLPGAQAVSAPEWVPWSERLRPGDVGVGDVLPTAADDIRLTLRQADTEGWVDDTLWLELGLGRSRVLSAEGRDHASERWWDGDRGPDAEIAKAAAQHCASCGFYVGLVGSLGRVFGVCANEWASDDGRVVATDHGCGAHSEAMVLPSEDPAERVDLHDPAAHDPGSVDDIDLGDTGGHS